MGLNFTLPSAFVWVVLTDQTFQRRQFPAPPISWGLSSIWMQVFSLLSLSLSLSLIRSSPEPFLMALPILKA